MKIFKIVIYTIGIIMLMMVSWCTYDHQFSERAIIGKENERKAATITSGMKFDKAIEIMGQPTS